MHYTSIVKSILFQAAKSLYFYMIGVIITAGLFKTYRRDPVVAMQNKSIE